MHGQGEHADQLAARRADHGRADEHAAVGVLDDLMVARHPDRLTLVVNANRKQDDLRHLAAALPDTVRLEAHEDRALLALQGPGAEAALWRPMLDWLLSLPP